MTDRTDDSTSTTAASNINSESLLAISVHYLATSFLEEVIAAGLDRTSSIYDIENSTSDNGDDALSSSLGVIRLKGVDVKCPIDGRKGAAYVHCIQGDHNVGIANFMLSYSWS